MPRCAETKTHKARSCQVLGPLLAAERGAAVSGGVKVQREVERWLAVAARATETVARLFLALPCRPRAERAALLRSLATRVLTLACQTAFQRRVCAVCAPLEDCAGGVRALLPRRCRLQSTLAQLCAPPAAPAAGDAACPSRLAMATAATAAARCLSAAPASHAPAARRRCQLPAPSSQPRLLLSSAILCLLTLSAAQAQPLRPNFRAAVPQALPDAGRCGVKRCAAAAASRPALTLQHQALCCCHCYQCSRCWLRCNWRSRRWGRCTGPGGMWGGRETGCGALARRLLPRGASRAGVALAGRAAVAERAL